MLPFFNFPVLISRKQQNYQNYKYFPGQRIKSFALFYFDLALIQREGNIYLMFKKIKARQVKGMQFLSVSFTVIGDKSFNLVWQYYFRQNFKTCLTV